MSSRFSAVALVLVITSIVASAQNMECAIVIPNNPLTAVGLSSPYFLKAFDAANGPCNMANAGQQSFVQGVILDSDTGHMFVYNPLVIDQGSQPAIPTIVPVLPTNFIIALWFGTNANILHLEPTLTHTLPDSTQQGVCVNGVLNGNQSDLFSQFSYCNAPAFFQKAKSLILAGTITVPPLGTASDGKPCPTVRDFSMVDQDQSDNVVTSYLLVTTAVQINGATVNAGQVAQNSAANRALLTTNAMVIVNPSDNRLITVAVDSVIGCTPWTAPDLADNSNPQSAVGLNELHAWYWQAQPMAQVPGGDPMAATNGVPNIVKLNAYRSGVAQAGVTQLSDADTTVYCQALASIAPGRLLGLKTQLIAGASPMPTVATTLWAFLVQRYAATWTILNCAASLGIPSPITQIFNAGGLTSDGTVNVVGNMIPASAFTTGPFSPGLAGGAVTASGGASSSSSTLSSSALVIGLAVALGVVVLIDLVILTWYLSVTYCCDGSSSSSSSRAYNPKFSAEAVSGPNDQSNYPMNPIPGQRQSVFTRVRQWV